MIPALELDAVSCRYERGSRSVMALDDVSLAVAVGELVAVMGPSGSGKSTLVHVSCGLVRPSLGAVRVGGQSALRMDQHIGANPGRRGGGKAQDVRGLGRDGRRAGGHHET